MNHHLEDEEQPHRERELTLSSGAILGIFLGLVVLCGGFFGFGYNMGRKSVPPPLALSDVNPTPAPTEDNLAVESKPSPSTPIGANSAAPAAPKTQRHTSSSISADERSSSSEEETDRHPTKAAPEVEAPRKEPAPIVRQPAAPAPVVSSATPQGSGSFMVQVAAVSHQDDANLLVSALRARGYAVSAHPVGSDNFIHVQVGPFRDKKEAEAMRQRLITDGYNAIVK